MKVIVKKEVSENIDGINVAVHTENDKEVSIHIYRGSACIPSLFVFNSPAKEVAATFRKIAEFLERTQ